MTTILRDPAFTAHALQFDEVLGPTPRLALVVETDAHEGPVYFADENALYFTTLPKAGFDGAPAVQIKRVDLDQPERISALVGEANAANGMAPDLEGGLLVCEQGSRSEHAQISRLDRLTGERETVVDHWRGLRFNSPDDVVRASDGSIWFTDPSYGHLQGFKPEPMVGDYVYRYDTATAQVEVVADSLDKPNGLAFSPDERVLYVTDSGANRAIDPTGASVVFEVVIDDYAEIWVNSQMPHALGDTGGHVAGGFNMPNRVLLTDDARPGQQFQIAVFGINGPISASPHNYIWMRTATLDFFAPERVRAATGVEVVVERIKSELDSVVTADATLERVAGGFEFTEGPVWSREGALLFSSPNTNTIYRWHPAGRVSVFRSKSGYSGLDIGRFVQPGSNGLTFDAERRVTLCQHGNRQVLRVEPHGNVTVLADRYERRRLNSPNDLVYRSDGTLFFTDPPFGLPGVFDDPDKELPFSGVFAVRNGAVTLVTDELEGPNGLAFSPDERYLYVGNWDPECKVVMRYELGADDELIGSSVLFDMTDADGEDAIDGLKVDQVGNVYACGPGGIWIIAADGAHLGTLRLPEAPHNIAWGDADGRTLYVTALTSVYRIRLEIPGIRP